MHTLHMSTANHTDKARLSMDVRWQPASDAPDPRYMGEAADPKKRVRAGIFGDEDASETGAGKAEGKEHPGAVASTGHTVAEFREQWGY
jgi:hypothetical protein